MKKSHRFNELSDKRCANPSCRRGIKKRIAEEQPHFDFCYRCHHKVEMKRRNEGTGKKRHKRALKEVKSIG